MKKTFALVALMNCGVLACTEGKQTGTSGGAQKPAVTQSPAAPFPSAGSPTGNLPVNCDPNKDFAALEFPEDIKACLLRDRLYNFDANTCTGMGKALWPCDLATLTSNLTDIELSTAPLENERRNGGKLIGCGASNDGLRIVAQFFYRNVSAPTNDCKFSAQGHVVSVCFQKFVDRAPVVPVTDAAKKAYVATCMTE